MPILTGDIKLVASQVMDDVPEGGGAPTATVITDGTSNAIFPDISELDRAGGRVNLRKLHVSVQTLDTDTYMGSNIIVSDPPEDPNVSITLFTTANTFDRRDAAASRVESYLNRGPVWGGMLLEDHITGQGAIQILQTKDSQLPSVGQTLVLVEHEKASNEYSQYVRTTAVSVIERTYYDSNEHPVVCWVVTCTLSDALRYDFTGNPGNYKLNQIPQACKLRDTVVADAGVYVGVTPLSATASLGAFTVNAASVFTQLVPSAQTETAISDVRTNGLASALVASGGALTQSISLAFTTSQNLFVGGPIYPSSLSIVRSGVTLTDKGGLLVNAGAEVGQVDYDNGVVSLSTNVWGTGGGAHQVTFVPATVPDLVSDQRSIRVTVESRSMSYAFTMGRSPVPRSMSISYLAQARWYVLRDDGSGALKGINSAYGVGTVSYSTASVSVTLGALPDVGSSIVVQSYSDATTVAVSNSLLRRGDKAYITINTNGELSDSPGAKPLKVGGVTVSWVDNAVTKYAYDNGLGAFTGDATGIILYSQGVIYLSPNSLPAPGTAFTVGVDEDRGSSYLNHTYSTANIVLHNAAISPVTIPGAAGYTIPSYTAHVMKTAATQTVVYPVPGGVKIPRTCRIYYYNSDSLEGKTYSKVFQTRLISVTIKDNGQGALSAVVDGNEIVIGSVDYASSQYLIGTWIPLAPEDDYGPVLLSVSGDTKKWNEYVAASVPDSAYRWMDMDGSSSGSATQVVTNPPEYEDVVVPAIDVPPTNPTTYTAPTLPLPPTVNVASVLVDRYFVSALMVPDYTLKGVGFTLAGSHFTELTDGTLIKDLNASTGGGAPAGSVSAATGLVTIQSWPNAASPTITDWHGLVAPPSVGAAAPFTAFATSFRSASSPLRPASLSVLGSMQDGTTFNVTANTQGLIDGTRVKGRVDYQYGLVELYFVNPAGDAALNVDLTFLSIPGLSTIPADLVMLGSLRYNAVAYSYLPLNAALLGIDPVRLPSDGRVPIFRSGGFAVVGNTQSITATVSNFQVIDCARVRLSRLRVLGLDGAVINSGYSADLEAGTVTFTNVTGYSQPVTIEHRIEDMAVVSDVQISGELTFTRPLTHDFPITTPASSFVSSALVAGDLKARVSMLFDQVTWSSVWQDNVAGSAATGTFNDVLAPIVVTNKGAVSERWALVFTNTTNFNVMGEHVGVIGTGTINADLAPLNPATGVPYFNVPELGWGLGWAAGNVLRFNTVGAMTPVWVVRTIQQGPNTGTEHSFTLLSRGDVDRP